MSNQITLGQFARAIRRLHQGPLLLRDTPMRAPGHVWVGHGMALQATVSRASIRQMEWNHRQGARGAMLITESIDSVPTAQAVTAQEQPAGSLFLEIQGQADLAMAEGH